MKNMPRITLVTPKISCSLPYPHLAVPSLVSYLRSNGFDDVRQVDLAAQVDQDDESLLFDSELIGISLAYPEQLPTGVILAREIRARNPGSVIVAGGASVTSRIDSLIRDPSFDVFDALVSGDGEEPLRMISESVLNSTGSLAGIPNCYWRGEGRFIPPKDRFVFSPDDYGVPEFPDREYSELPIRTGKGCYWRKCSFCTYRTVFDGYLRPNVDSAVDQMEKLQARYGTSHFTIVDDAIPATALKKLADAIVQRGLNVSWNCSAVFDKKFRDPEVAESLARANCRTVFFGFESASPRVLALMGKMNDIHSVTTILENLTRSGVGAHLNVIIGFPTERWSEAKTTIKFLSQYRTIFSNFHAQTFSLEEESDVFKERDQFGIRKVQPVLSQGTSARMGYDFECNSGMNSTRRRFMTMRCRLAFRKSGSRLLDHWRRHLESYAYAALHPVGMILNR